MPEPDRAFAAERRAGIVKIVAARGRARVQELGEEFAVSAPTIRKDLSVLETQKRVRRTHGGVIPWDDHAEAGIEQRRAINPDAKGVIGRIAADLIKAGESIYLDSGTTVKEIAARLELPGVRVLTNSVDVAIAVADRPLVEHTLVGGSYRSLGGSVVGPVAMSQLKQFQVSTAFIGVTGMSPAGLWCADVEEAQLKSWMVRHAGRVVVVMDHTKFGAVDFALVCDVEDVDVLVTDAAPKQVHELCAARGIELIEGRP